MKRLTTALVVAAALLTVTPGRASADDGEAGKFRLFGQTTTFLELNRGEDSQTDRDYTKIKQLVSFNVEWSNWTAGAQVEYLDYSDIQLVDPLDLDRLHDTVEARKFYLDYTTDHFSGRLGTFFSSLGRGLTLYVQKNEALGFDEPIRGATATATFDHVDVTVLGGEVTEPVLQNQYDRTFTDTVWGGRVLTRLPHDFYLGGSYVRARLDRFFPEGEDEVEVWSVEGGGSSIGGLVDLHAEWAEIENRTFTGTKDGWGGYCSASSYLGMFTILAEYKDYWNFQYRYNSPPNAGRAIEAYNHNDVKGPRLMVSADLQSIGMVAFASYGWFNTHRKPTSLGGVGGDQQNEWYVGVEELAGPVYLESSYFRRNWSNRGVREEHILSDLHLGTGARGEILTGYEKRQESSSYYGLATHRSYAGYSLSPYGALTVRYAWEEKTGFDTDKFWGAELEYLPSSAFTLQLFVGSDPGGLVCAGGQCRIEPRFKGARATFTWRF